VSLTTVKAIEDALARENDPRAVQAIFSALLVQYQLQHETDVALLKQASDENTTLRAFNKAYHDQLTQLVHPV